MSLRELLERLLPIGVPPEPEVTLEEVQHKGLQLVFEMEQKLRQAKSALAKGKVEAACEHLSVLHATTETLYGELQDFVGNDY